MPIADSDPRLAVFGAQSEKKELLAAPAVKADNKIISKKEAIAVDALAAPAEAQVSVKGDDTKIKA